MNGINNIANVTTTPFIYFLTHLFIFLLLLRVTAPGQTQIRDANPPIMFCKSCAPKLYFASPTRESIHISNTRSSIKGTGRGSRLISLSNSWGNERRRTRHHSSSKA
uniref:Putative secreted protein n=1 Tax=Anopheles darlingi TaxID=43151 RepID=A0A2M4D619_ANODA